MEHFPKCWKQLSEKRLIFNHIYPGFDWRSNLWCSNIYQLTKFRIPWDCFHLKDEAASDGTKKTSIQQLLKLNTHAAVMVLKVTKQFFCVKHIFRGSNCDFVKRKVQLEIFFSPICFCHSSNTQKLTGLKWKHGMMLNVEFLTLF